MGLKMTPLEQKEWEQVGQNLSDAKVELEQLAQHPSEKVATGAKKGLQRIEELMKELHADIRKAAEQQKGPESPIAGEKVTLVDTVEVARYIRRRLKHDHPETKFYVRSERYSGGSSININWIDGPTVSEIYSFTGALSGKDFDGMIDMACPVYHWEDAEGNYHPAYSSGTEGSNGMISSFYHERPEPGAKLVRLMGDYVFAERVYSKDFVEKVGQIYHQESGEEIPDIGEGAWFVAGRERGKIANFVSPDKWDNDTRARIQRFNNRLKLLSQADLEKNKDGLAQEIE